MHRYILRRLTTSTAVPLFAIAFSATSAMAADAAPATPAAAAATPAAQPANWGSFGVQTVHIDSAVKPGDDFNAFVNGKWMAATEMPADKTRLGAFMDLRDLSDERMHAIMNELAAKSHAPGSAEARLADAWKAYMDTAAIDAKGLAPAKPWLDRIAAAKTTADVVNLFAQPGFASPITASIDADAKNSGTNALYLGQGGIGLPDRDYYLSSDAKHVAIRGKYLEFLTTLLGKAGYADAPGTARQVLDLETAMARAMWDRTIGRNVDLIYNRLERPDLVKLDKAGVMSGFLMGLGADAATYAVVGEMPPTAEEMTAAKLSSDPAKMGGGVPATLELVKATPVATWKAYLAAQFLSSHAQFLPGDIDDARFALYGTALSGQLKQRDRWRRGIAAVEGQIGELAGQIYAQRHFPTANKVAMDELVANLRKAMAANLVDLQWMGPETRVQAQAKLDAFTPKIGYPDRYKTYDGLSIAADTPLANQVNAEKWAFADRLARIGKPVDRSEWFMLPETVNAYYNPLQNEIVFPAAILQPPFFNLGADPAVNYGAIGAVIGHEMGHGFDDQGAKFDGTGNLRDWWTKDDIANFQKLQDALATQYDAFCPFDDGKTCVNGRLTMGENIGDLGGLSLAYRAYKLSLGGKPAPVIDGFTGDQRFFMGWAQVWRSKTREEQARQFLVVDPHSPSEYRVNGIVRNFDEWYRAFDIKPGDKLYLPPEQRLRIW
jgi:putative endopeptidase